MSTTTSLKSAMFPWRRGAATPAISENLTEPSESRSCKKLSADAPEFVPRALKEKPIESTAIAELKTRFPWRRTQPSNKIDSEEDNVSKTCSFGECSTASSIDSSSVPSEPEPEDQRDTEADAKGLSDDEAKGQNVEVPKQGGSFSVCEDSTPCSRPHQAFRTLQVSANSWAARQRSRRMQANEGEENLSDEEIVRKMKSILNKLTIEKFPILSKQLTSCGIRSTMHLEVLIQEILEKATTQHHFINMYSDLCVTLQEQFADNCFSTDPKMSFKRILLIATQASFERHLAPSADLKMLEGEDLEAAKHLYKLQMIGNIKFVGALLVRKMLAGKVGFAIIGELLSDSSAEALESLAALLTVIGPHFDDPESPHRVMFTGVFDQVQARIKDSKVNNRVRCLLKDVMELRATGWLDRKPKKLEGPSTLEEVAQKLQAEADAPLQKTPTETEIPSVRKPLQLAPPTVAQRHPIDIESPSARKPLQLAAPTASTPTSKQQVGQALNTSSVPKPQACQHSAFDDKLLMFIKANGIDEEGAGDLKACAREVQELVLAKGDCTSARNPSAMVRVRINQALRELKKRAKAGEPARPLKSAGESPNASGAKPKPAPWSQQPVRQPKKEKEEPKEQSPKKAASREEFREAFAELMVSHDVREAVTRMAALVAPQSTLPEHVCDLLLLTVEQGSDVLRMLGFKLIVAMFAGGCWKPAALQEALQSFANSCDDLKLDVPALPRIIKEEMAPAFRPLVASGVLSAQYLQALCGAF